MTSQGHKGSVWGACAVQLLLPVSAFVAAALIFPGISAGSVALLCLLALCGVYAGRNFGPVAGSGYGLMMSVAGTLLGVGIVLNTWYFCTLHGAGPADPWLINTDQCRWWNDALYNMGVEGAVPAHEAYGFYGDVVAGFLWLTGVSVANAMALSMACTLVSLLVVGRLAWRLCGDRRTSLLAVVCTAAVCYWLAVGTLLLKDSMVILAMVTATYGFTCRGWRVWAYVLPCFVVLAAVRHNYLLMLAAGGIYVCRDLSWRQRLLLFVVPVMLWCVMQWCKVNASVEFIIQADPRTLVRYDRPNQMALTALTGDYSELAWWRKVLLMPVSALVQFLIPFPWRLMNYVDFGVTNIWAQIAYPWYVFGGVLVFYLFCGLRGLRIVGDGVRRSMMWRVTVWGVFCWLVPCYLFGGTISRYGLPMVALFAPAVAYTLRRCRGKRPFLVYMGIYAVCMAVGLCVCYFLQTRYM